MTRFLTELLVGGYPFVSVGRVSSFGCWCSGRSFAGSAQPQVRRLFLRSSNVLVLVYTDGYAPYGPILTRIYSFELFDMRESVVPNNIWSLDLCPS